MLRKFSNWLVSDKNRKRAVACVYMALVILALIFCGTRIYKDSVKEAVQNAGGTPKPEHIMEKEKKEQYEIRKKEADDSYKNGTAGMSGDEITGSEGNEESGDAELIGQDWYDNDGNQLWKGIIKDTYSENEKEAFKKAYEEYERRTSEENEDSKLTIDKTGTASSRLVNLCYDYNEKIPYAQEEYSYYLGYFTQPDGYDNTPYIKKGQHGSGLCGLGYVTWVIRNVLGKTPEALKGKTFSEKKAMAVEVDSLQIGDICIAEVNGGRVYGVVSYMEDGKAVISLEDSTCTPKFPCGCNHYAYIRSQYDAYIYDHAAVDFTMFYRLNEWEE